MTAFAPAAHPHLLPQWAVHLGMAGLFFTSILDSSVIPLAVPGTTDLFLLWLISHNGNPWLLASIAIAGGLIGGYTSWSIGKKGGEAALERWVPARILKRIVRWVKRHPILAVFLPAIMPPPIPLSPFILAAGALGVARKPFLLAFGAARTLRYSLVAWLAVKYGRHMVRVWSGTLEKWETPLLWIFAAVVVSGVALGIVKLRGQARLAPAV
ncbi:MAG: VTT domain-containing protein [Terracidiphilus sp.]|jgi:membrane protein YqaA with SNARE-associated domain